MKHSRLPQPSHDDWRGIAYLCGILLVGYGGWLIEPPVGFLSAGAALILTIRPLRRWYD